MKTKLQIILLITAWMVVVNLRADDYVLISPFDSAVLPVVSSNDNGGGIVRYALSTESLWRSTKNKLERNHFSDESVYNLMRKLYRFTHSYYVTFPCAYWSETPQGDSLLVSGRVYLPKNRELKGIVVANHYTICSDTEAPSNTISMESVFTMKGYAVIMPDYVGYGLSRDKVHPYLHWRSAAQTAVDLLDCMPAMLDYYGYSYPTDVIVEGYSQGAAVALGVTRLLEERAADESNDEKVIWTVRKLYAGAGPYDPAATYDYCVAKDTMGIPAAIPLIVMGLNDAYHLGFTLEDFFLDPLLSHYDEWIGTKQYTVSQINEHMGSTCMSVLMTPSSLDREQKLTKLLYDVLEQNSNVGYDLRSPAYFLHSVEDDVVPVINSQNLAAEMPDDAKITYDFGMYGSHMAASVPFMKYVYLDL